MTTNKKKTILIIYSILILPVMAFLFTIFGKVFENSFEYFIPYGAYFIILLTGLLYFNNSKTNCQPLKINHKIIFYIIAFIPVIAIFFVAFLPSLRYIQIPTLLLLFVYAFINGLLEELFWRFTYNKIFQGSVLLAYIVPTLVFTCWHFALLFATGVHYNGGAVALVGGACIMSFIWGFVMYNTKNIKVVIIAHILANFFAFSQLICENWIAVPV